MDSSQIRITSGVSELDRLLGGLFIGDNVVWYDDAGSLAGTFCINFIQASQAENKFVIYVSFDRSPNNLLEKLGDLAENPRLTIVDCFTCGKGEGSDIFNRFYKKDRHRRQSCNIVKINEPQAFRQVMAALQNIHKPLQGDVRFVFESLTGMQDLWGGEEAVLKFYTHSCPQLYELNTIAYWIAEKGAHSLRLKAHINQIAQVAVDLSMKRGRSSLTLLKAEKRNPGTVNTPRYYWTDGTQIRFEDQKRASGPIDIGQRLKALRTRQGISQTELARSVGVTPSTISQIESNLIYPSLPALFKIADTLSIKISAFFQEKARQNDPVVFSVTGGVNIRFPNLPKESIQGKLLTPIGSTPRVETSVIEIPEHTVLPAHFYMHKGEEFGYVTAGRLQMEIKQVAYDLSAGDIIYLTAEVPSQWKNPGPGPARLLWLKIR
ncbi:MULTISPECIES: helix-turn-helix domain-containing protein [Desulfococcus]|uniref:Transcriptional regulator, XRE family n=1 Tax=Desulfococcus multivorans DSM 2059 TaxID=1121405 RepID=S7U0X7_DESML|nr:helix-turn-helix domain-containing protein [Desulfococcus multivorans]AOY58862.1 transcriptional regulator, XRE family [Desulfococcus multivorans]AQV01147.1 XRE family transcriptional regulator [Desulfococcus multivorans]EPR42987.1 transcriptional regulator, XRE family [Desulfococcus multivorans DSM 2059]SJZ52009.1 transcriptional regulator, XRE family with cupin sensor [Desulfococcus multivorans DSM 2059]